MNEAFLPGNKRSYDRAAGAALLLLALCTAAPAHAQISAVQFDDSRSPTLDLFLSLPEGGASETFSVLERTPSGDPAAPATAVEAVPLSGLLRGDAPYPYARPAVDVVFTWAAPAREVRQFLRDCADALGTPDATATWKPVPSAAVRFMALEPHTAEMRVADDAVQALDLIRENVADWVRRTPRGLIRRREDGNLPLETLADRMGSLSYPETVSPAPIRLHVVFWSPAHEPGLVPHSALEKLTRDRNIRVLLLDITSATSERKGVMMRILNRLAAVDAVDYENVFTADRRPDRSLCRVHALSLDALGAHAAGHYLLTVETRDLSPSEWTRFTLTRVGAAGQAELACRRRVLTEARARHARDLHARIQSLATRNLFAEAAHTIRELRDFDPALAQEAAPQLVQRWEAEILRLASRDPDGAPGEAALRDLASAALLDAAEQTALDARVRQRRLDTLGKSMDAFVGQHAFRQAAAMLPTWEELGGEAAVMARAEDLRGRWRTHVLELAGADPSERFRQEWEALRQSDLEDPAALGALRADAYATAARAAVQAGDPGRASARYREWIRAAADAGHGSRADWLDAHRWLTGDLRRQGAPDDAVAGQINAFIRRFGPDGAEEEWRDMALPWLVSGGPAEFFRRTVLIDDWGFIDRVLARETPETARIRGAWRSAVRGSGLRQAAQLLAAEGPVTSLHEAPPGYFSLHRAEHARPLVAHALAQASALGLGAETWVQAADAAIPFTENSHRTLYRAAVRFQMHPPPRVLTADQMPAELPVAWAFLQRASRPDPDRPQPVTLAWTYEADPGPRRLVTWLICPFGPDTMIAFPFRDVPNHTTGGVPIQEELEQSLAADRSVLVTHAVDLLLQGMLAGTGGNPAADRVWEALLGLHQVDPAIITLVVLHETGESGAPPSAGSSRSFPPDPAAVAAGLDSAAAPVAYTRDLPGGGFEIGRPVIPEDDSLPMMLVRVRVGLNRQAVGTDAE